MKTEEKPKMVVKPHTNAKKQVIGWQIIEEPKGVQVYLHQREDGDVLDPETSALIKKQTEDYATIKKFQFYVPKKKAKYVSAQW